LGNAWQHPELVFPSETGTIMEPKNFYRSWKLAVAKAGLPPTRIHDIRHVNISLLILLGEDPKTVSERAGHTSTSFTLDRYGHVFREQRQWAARSIDELLGAANGTVGKELTLPEDADTPDTAEDDAARGAS
jgi:integrase